MTSPRFPAHLSAIPAPREQRHARDPWLICPSCGDHPYLAYSEVSSRLQRIRGPYSLEAGLTAYEKHRGLFPRRHEARPGRSGDAKPAARRAALLDFANAPTGAPQLWGIAETVYPGRSPQ